MGTKKPMRVERSDVKHPLWRKKVDKSVFGHRMNGGTTIPRWMWAPWGLEEAFAGCASEKDPRSNVRVFFEGIEYQGHVTMAAKGRENTPACRLWFPDELCLRLRATFPMSYLRALERELTEGTKRDVETEIPFWEFLDIEYDSAAREFHLSAHYVQAPTFPLLCGHLISGGDLASVVPPGPDE